MAGLLARSLDRALYLLTSLRDGARLLVATAHNRLYAVLDRAWPAPRVRCELCG
ncbi:MAG: hypothetical protein JXR83_19145 [Deltaproteobacteria bacterium]|nr:hypothetical protein [Deltaproteobacteria bacterium]